MACLGEDFGTDGAATAGTNYHNICFNSYCF